MSHEYRLEGNGWGVITDTRASGGYVFIPCQTLSGEEVRLKLEFDRSAIIKLADTISRIAEAVRVDPRNT